MAVALSKEEAVKKISLRKDKVVSLAKKQGIADVKARVALVLDFSGSMHGLISDGTVQRVIERLVPIALNFDDNGVLDFWVFDNDFHRLDGITLDNFYGIAEKAWKRFGSGGTEYSPVIYDVDKFYIEEKPENIPNYVIFITDGDDYSQDKPLAEQALVQVSEHPIFFQFVGIGSHDFHFLESLDDMKGRCVDNANFFAVDDIDVMSDDDLYNKLLAEFPKWLAYDEVKDMLKDVSSLGVVNQGHKQKKGFLSRLFGK